MHCYGLLPCLLYESIDCDTTLAFIQSTPCEVATGAWRVEKGTVMRYKEVTTAFYRQATIIHVHRDLHINR